LPPPAGARKGLPYNAAAVRLRTTRTDLNKMMAICLGPQDPKPSKIGRKVRPAASTPAHFSGPRAQAPGRL